MYKKLFMFLTSAMICQTAFSVQPLNIPDKYLLKDRTTGCKMVGIHGGGEVDYTGKCVAGYANGIGKTYEGTKYYDMGFVLGASRDTQISTKDSKGNTCLIGIPNEYYSSEFENLFTAKFTDNYACGEYDKERNMDIYFNNQYFATYTGKITKIGSWVRRGYLDSGKLKVFTGSEYQVGTPTDSAFAIKELWEDKFKQIKAGDSGSSKYTEDDFYIKIGSSSKVTKSEVDSWLFMQFDSASNDVYLYYDIKPKKSLNSNNLKLTMNVRIEYTRKSTTDGWLNTSTDEKLEKFVTIDLLKNKGFKAKGKVLLGKLDTFLSAGSIDSRLTDFKTKVRVVTIDEE